MIRALFGLPAHHWGGLQGWIGLPVCLTALQLVLLRLQLEERTWQRPRCSPETAPSLITLISLETVQAHLRPTLLIVARSAMLLAQLFARPLCGSTMPATLNRQRRLFPHPLALLLVGPHRVDLRRRYHVNSTGRTLRQMASSVENSTRRESTYPILPLFASGFLTISAPTTGGVLKPWPAAMPNVLPAAIATGPQLPGLFNSEFGFLAPPAFESLAPSLSPNDWGLHGPEMFWRDWPCDSQIITYFNVSAAFLDEFGDDSFKAQLFLCSIAQSVNMKNFIEQRRAQNFLGNLLWQVINFVWSVVNVWDGAFWMRCFSRVIAFSH